MGAKRKVTSLSGTTYRIPVTEKHEITQRESDCDHLCGTCGSEIHVCSCGWSGCIFSIGKDNDRHQAMYRAQEVR